MFSSGAAKSVENLTTLSPGASPLTRGEPFLHMLGSCLCALSWSLTMLDSVAAGTIKLILGLPHDETRQARFVPLEVLWIQPQTVGPAHFTNLTTMVRHCRPVSAHPMLTIRSYLDSPSTPDSTDRSTTPYSSAGLEHP